MRFVVASGVHAGLDRLVQAWTTTGALSAPAMVKPNPLFCAPKLGLLVRITGEGGVHCAVGDLPVCSPPCGAVQVIIGRVDHRKRVVAGAGRIAHKMDSLQAGAKVECAVPDAGYVVLNVQVGQSHAGGERPVSDGDGVGGIVGGSREMNIDRIVS